MLYAIFENLNATKLQLELPEPTPEQVQRAQVRGQQQKELKAIKFEAVQEDEEDQEEEKKEDEAGEPEEKQIDTSSPPSMQMQNQEEAKDGEDKEEEAGQEEKEKEEEESEESEEEEHVRSTTVFQEISRVLAAVMRNGHSPNLKVKHLCVYQLFPKLVNLTVPFLKFEQSEAFLKMMLRASRIKWGEGLSKNAKAAKAENEKHIVPYINLNKDFLKTGGLVMSGGASGLGNFAALLTTLRVGYTHTGEQIKRESLKTVFLYLQELNRQVISKVQGDTQAATDEARFALLSTTNFLAPITTATLPLLKDYFDSVRAEACIVTEFIVTHFLTLKPQLDKEQSDLVMMLRGSVTLGWSSTVAAPLK